ncbi:MAG TPA: rubredoxin [Flavisolibacter sp.]|nr:rubredoxin [Flavisolibacter sp.]
MDLQTQPLARKTGFHQFKHRLTVYVPALGDETQGIAPGNEFGGLPSQFCCPLCESPKDSFVEVEEEQAG